MFTQQHLAQLLLATVALCVLVWVGTRFLRSAFLFVFAPLLKEKGDGLSLGRTCLVFWLVVQAWLILRHPSFFQNLQWPPALVIIFSDLFLMAYNFGNKPATRELGNRLVERFTFGGAAGNVVASVQAVAQAKVEKENAS